MKNFDRQKPYNDLPLLPPNEDIENNPCHFKTTSFGIQSFSNSKWKFK